MNYCERIGRDFDTFKHRRCSNISAIETCLVTKHNLSIDNEGWLLCSANCPKPFYVKPPKDKVEFLCLCGAESTIQMVGKNDADGKNLCSCGRHITIHLRRNKI
jgi:hypothetical protein